MPTKESRELYLFERFLPVLFEGKTYTLSQPKPPLPDVVIQLNGRKIGIEMTALILNEKARERESKQDSILNEAQRLFEKQSQLRLQVTVDFSEAANWDILDCSSVAGPLAAAVERCVLGVKDLPQCATEFHIRTEAFIHSHIQSATISFLNRITVSCWSPITGFCVPDAPVEKIQEVIEKKSKKVNGYLSGCDEVWLLMLETGSPSSYYDGYEKLNKFRFESDFTRTLIGRIPNGEVVELVTQSMPNFLESHS